MDVYDDDEEEEEEEEWKDQELDGRMWFRGMHYNCWG
jgi:hypothetical protein